MSLEHTFEACCKKDCLRLVRKEELGRVQLRMCAMSFKEQRSWLLTTLSTSFDSETNQFTHTICGKIVCLKAFLKATTISRSRYFEVRARFLQGHFQLPSLESTRFRTSTEMARQWLRLYARENGDKLPDHNRILLPSSLTKSAVYEQYSAEYSSSRYEYVNEHGHLLVSRMTILLLMQV